MNDAFDFEAGLAAMRAQTKSDTLNRIAADADEAARNALAHHTEDDWLGVEFAEALLLAARALRQAGRTPSPAVVEAMARCTAAHRAWADVWGEAEAAEMSRALSPAIAAARPIAASDADTSLPRVKVGLGEIVQTMLKAREP